MDRGQLIEQLEKALELAKTSRADEISFDIDSVEHHVFFEPEAREDIDEEPIEDTGAYVESIPYLAEWP